MNLSNDLTQTANQVVAGITDEVSRAVALHDYIRERVRFGFNKYFDAPPDAYTLAYGYGQCVPKSHLLVSLMRAVGFECHQHFVTLSKEFMSGVIPANRYWMISREVSHSYVDVLVAGKWCAIDSFVIDTPLLKGALKRLAQEGRQVGYGVRIGAVNQWDGQSDAFAQYRPDLSSEDHGRVDDLEAYFASKHYHNKFLGVPFNKLFLMLGEANTDSINANIEQLRVY